MYDPLCLVYFFLLFVLYFGFGVRRISVLNDEVCNSLALDSSLRGIQHQIRLTLPTT